MVPGSQQHPQLRQLLLQHRAGARRQRGGDQQQRLGCAAGLAARRLHAGNQRHLHLLQRQLRLHLAPHGRQPGAACGLRPIGGRAVGIELRCPHLAPGRRRRRPRALQRAGFQRQQHAALGAVQRPGPAAQRAGRCQRGRRCRAGGRRRAGVPGGRLGQLQLRQRRQRQPVVPVRQRRGGATAAAGAGPDRVGHARRRHAAAQLHLHARHSPVAGAGPSQQRYRQFGDLVAAGPLRHRQQQHQPVAGHQHPQRAAAGAVGRGLHAERLGQRLCVQRLRVPPVRRRRRVAAGQWRGGVGPGRAHRRDGGLCHRRRGRRPPVRRLPRSDHPHLWLRPGVGQLPLQLHRLRAPDRPLWPPGQRQRAG